MSGRATNPAAAVRAFFEHVAASAMADMPLCNPALAVATVGFRRWREHWLGALLTPWCMNLMLLPDAEAAAGREGETRWLKFPSGDYPFIVHRCDELGAYLSCSLYSPLFEFDSQAAAQQVAEEALRALLAPADAADELAAAREAARLQGRAPSAVEVSRRGFLRALLPGGVAPGRP